MNYLTKLFLLQYLCLAVGVQAQTVVITSGGAYSGHNLTDTSADYNSPAISVQTTEPVTIQYCAITTKGYGITCIAGAKIPSEHCYFAFNGTGTNPSKLVLTIAGAGYLLFQTSVPDTA